MRLLQVRLKNYRGVDDCTVEFPASGVTVIEGDNEVGKSCIPEAVKMILSEMDSSGKRSVKAVRPVHRDAGPEVEIEASSGDYRFTYFKRWHRKPETRLDVTAPRREQLTGREAHERVEAILNETLDRELWQALSVEQGAEPGIPALGVPSLGQALDLAAGGQQEAGADDALWERICTERSRYWTDTGQAIKARKDRAEELAAAQNEVGDLNERIQAIQKDAEEVERLAGEEAELASQRDDAENTEGELSQEWEATEGLRNQVEQLNANHSAALAQLKLIEDAGQRRQELIQAVADRGEELAARKAEVDQAAPGLALAVKHRDVTADALAAAQSALNAAQARLHLANDDRDFRRNEIEKDQLYERNERVLKAQERLQNAEAVLESSKVDEALVHQIDQAAIEETRAKAALEASAASVEVEALSVQSVLIDGEEVTMGANAIQKTHVTDKWELAVPNQVRVWVKAGGDSRDVAADFRAAQQEHARLCALGGVSDLAEARQRAEERKEAERIRGDAITAIEENLRDLTSEGLAQKLEGITRRVAAYPAERTGESAIPGDFEEAKKVALGTGAEADDCQAEVERCRDNASQAAEASNQAQVDSAVQAQKLESAQGMLNQAEGNLAKAQEEQPDSELDGALSARRTEVEDSAAALQQAKAELQAKDPESLKAKLDNASAAKNRAETDLRNNQDRRRELLGRLEAQGGAGLHSQLNDAESETQRLTREHEGIEARAQAAFLLHQTFEQRRQEAHQRYIAPFKEQIEQLGRIVFGPTFEVELDDELRVTRRTLDGTTLDLNQLSVGAREQIGVICRLACASIVSPDGGGAPVVIDDALGWSDPARLQGMGAAIASAGDQCQVIVLTCMPRRYSHVGNAKVVRLHG